MKGKFSMDPRANKVWAVVTDDAKDLIKKLITVDPQARLSASEALCHQWFTNDLAIVERAENLMAAGRSKTARRISSIAQGNQMIKLWVESTLPHCFDIF